MKPLFRINGWVKTLTLLAASFTLAVGLSAHPKVMGSEARADAFDRFVASMRVKARKRGIKTSVFDRAFKGVRPNPEVLKLARYQPEFRSPVWAYIDKRVSDTRIANGRAKMKKHARVLNALQKRYGVPKRFLVSIWGIESRYGEYKGEMNVIRSLATLGYKGKRRKFGRSQLIAALKILQRGDIKLSQFTGSWAGAMGHTQFIPTTYNAYAVDWTGDGTRDIWNSTSDALASTANYLRKAGWRTGQVWGVEVKAPKRLKVNRKRLGKSRSVASWIKRGVKPIRGGKLSNRKRKAWLYSPSGKSGPSFLVYRNFRVIMRYNNSTSYALAVALLGDRIVGKRDVIGKWPRSGTPLNRAGRVSIQLELKALGLYDGEVDGRIGSGTEKAVRLYQKRIGVKQDGYPSVELLKRMRRS
ncbi:MAG: lytic murein transglycosylase [Hyphomicrobiales bacterium]